MRGQGERKHCVAEHSLETNVEVFMGLTYPLLPIQPAKNLADARKPELIESLKSNHGKVNSLRAVRGDGNCFIRAFAFIYISSFKSTSLEKCLPLLDQVKLTSCEMQTIPRRFRQYYDDNLLRKALTLHFQPLYQALLKQTQGKSNYRRALCLLLNRYNSIDFVIILYFRAVLALKFNQLFDIYKDFASPNQLLNLKSYGLESEGIVIDLSSRVFKMSLTIFQLSKNKMNIYEQKYPDAIYKGYLLLEQKHYDILEMYAEVSEEASDPCDPSEEYFTEVSEDLGRGRCYECSFEGIIHTDSGLCKQCYEKSRKTLMGFSFSGQPKTAVADMTRQSIKNSQQKCSTCRARDACNGSLCQDCFSKSQFVAPKISFCKKESYPTGRGSTNSSLSSKEFLAIKSQPNKQFQTLSSPPSLFVQQITASNPLRPSHRRLTSQEKRPRQSRDKIVHLKTSPSIYPDSKEQKLPISIPQSKIGHSPRKIEITICGSCSKQIRSNEAYCFECAEETKFDKCKMCNYERIVFVNCGFCQICKSLRQKPNSIEPVRQVEKVKRVDTKQFANFTKNDYYRSVECRQCQKFFEVVNSPSISDYFCCGECRSRTSSNSMAGGYRTSSSKIIVMSADADPRAQTNYLDKCGRCWKNANLTFESLSGLRLCSECLQEVEKRRRLNSKMRESRRSTSLLKSKGFCANCNFYGGISFDKISHRMFCEKCQLQKAVTQVKKLSKHKSRERQFVEIKRGSLVKEPGLKIDNYVANCRDCEESMKLERGKCRGCMLREMKRLGEERTGRVK